MLGQHHFVIIRGGGGAEIDGVFVVSVGLTAVGIAAGAAQGELGVVQIERAASGGNVGAEIERGIVDRDRGIDRE